MRMCASRSWRSSWFDFFAQNGTVKEIEVSIMLENKTVDQLRTMRKAQGLVCGIVAQQVLGTTDAITLGAKIGIS